MFLIMILMCYINLLYQILTVDVEFVLFIIIITYLIFLSSISYIHFSGKALDTIGKGVLTGIGIGIGINYSRYFSRCF